MKITCPAFDNGDVIPDKYSRYADDRTPPLEFSDVPEETQSLVLILDDPDAPSGLFTHWVVFNIDPRIAGFPENDPPRNVGLGMTSWGEAGYGGPQPPDREHRYFFRLYALDTRLDMPHGAPREKVEAAIQGHMLAHAELMGRYAPPVAQT
jgi:Raf kinase inhibitor-like YbhB/YbcL family protein